MGKPVNSNVPRIDTFAFSTKVNKEVFKEFKDYLSKHGYPMNVILETFMQQYSNGRIKMNNEDVLKFKNDKTEVDVLSTTISVKNYSNFKDTCKSQKYYMKHVITAFMEKFSSGNYILEYVSIEESVDCNNVTKM